MPLFIPGVLQVCISYEVVRDMYGHMTKSTFRAKKDMTFDILIGKLAAEIFQTSVAPTASTPTKTMASSKSSKLKADQYAIRNDAACH